MNRKIRFTLLVFWLSLPCAGFVFAQSGWARTFGGGSADTPTAVVPTPDGGFVVAGSTASFGAGSDDGWITKMDATGSVQWQKAYGGSTFEELWALQITTDGGYIAAGTTGVYPNADVWILKLSAAGDIEWQKSFGGPNYDEGLAIQQTSDGGYIVVCNTSSFGAGIGDAWILKLSSSGGVQWQKTYGGPQYEYALSIQQTTDGGYIVGGLTQSFGAGGSDIWVLKLDSLGSVVWQKAFGTNLQDYASALQQTTDGGYIVAGKVGTGTDDWVVLKLDSSGNIQWQRTYGGAGFDMVSALEQTADGGYVVSGTTTSFGAGSYDIWILKLDNTGAVQWQKSYGGGDNDHNGLIRQMPGGGYIVAATTLSFGSGDFDTWILRLDANGEIGASCNLPSDTLAAPTFSSLNAVATSVSGVSTAATVSNTTFAATTTIAGVSEQCGVSCIFCDDFEDGILAADWTYLKATWSESGGNLVATAPKKAVAVASPAFGGCSTCSFEASLATAGGTGNKVSMFAWYTDKNNNLEVLMKQESNKVIMKQRAGGSVVAKAKGSVTLIPNISYNVKVTFDGATFTLFVDGNLLATLPAASPAPGTIGFQAKRTTARFGHVLVE